MSKTPHVVVLGAGVCGLYAGRVLTRAGFRVTVLESEDLIGGLACGRLIDGNYYDLGVHHLHEFDREIFEDISDIMGPDLLAVEKSAKIRYGNGYRRYPLEFTDLLRGIPPWTLARALAGMIAQQARNRVSPSEPRNAEEALIQLYGRPLYGFFFRDFTHRYWGIPPEGLSATFVQRKMPRLSAVDMVKKALSRFGVKEREGAAVESAVAHETLHYGRTGSRELPLALARAITEGGGRVLTSSPVVGVKTKGDRVVAVRYRRGAVGGADRDAGDVGGEADIADDLENRPQLGDGQDEVTLECDYCISTVPLPILVQALEPEPPADVGASSRELRFRPLAVYGLLIGRERVLDALYIYFRDRVFHRVAEPKNSGLDVQPEGHTLLLAEMTCSMGDDRWSGGEETRRQIVADLEAEGLLHPDEVVATHLVRSAYGYPVFELGFEPHYERVVEYIGRFENLWSTGRQGGFSYPNMHGAMRMGADAASEIVRVGHHVSAGEEEEPEQTIDASGLSLADGDMAEMSADGAESADTADGARSVDTGDGTDGPEGSDSADGAAGAETTELDADRVRDQGGAGS